MHFAQGRARGLAITTNARTARQLSKGIAARSIHSRPPASSCGSKQVLRIANRLFDDPESDILGFMVSVYRTDGWLIQPDVWTGPMDFITLGVELLDKQSFYAVVTAYNKAELTVTVRSNNVRHTPS